ncbi:MAG TPA: SDR family oxidoreductase [Candidatus Binataceae bacterium]|nr:SDR family oxidoreductase [Candidatus Binataceae bacterium]
MDLGLKGKTALVLGASKGLGRGVADALAAEGVAVALVARGKEALDQAVAEINARGGRAIGVQADLSADWPVVEAAAKSARQQLGPIDILLNNSGGPPPARVIGIAPDVWEAQFRSMVLVYFRLTEMFLPEMRERKWGRIINVASESVVQPIPHIAISNTLRGAVVGWAKTLAGEVARDGITVNTMLPGAFDTDRVRQIQRATSAREGVSVEEFAQRAARTIPVGRMGTATEFGAMAAFLASPLAGYITGSMIRLDGGSVRGI